MAKLAKKQYDFTDDNGKQVTGWTYVVQVQTPYGLAELKVLAKSDLERKLLDSEIEKQK